MRYFYIYGFLVFFGCLVLPALAAQNQPDVAQVMKQHLEKERLEKTRLTGQESLETIKPGLAEILDDSVPWGVNLALVNERGANVRKSIAGGGADFSSKITLYQKHKSVDKNLKVQQVTVEEKLKKAKADLASLNPVKIYRRPKTRKIIKALKDEQASLEEKIKKNEGMMKIFEKTIMVSTGLTLVQVQNLPGLDEWKEGASR